MHFTKIVKFLLIQLQNKPSGTSRYLEIAPILGFLVPNGFLGQNSTHINSHFDSDNFYQKGCTLMYISFHLFCHYIRFNIQHYLVPLQHDAWQRQSFHFSSGFLVFNITITSIRKHKIDLIIISQVSIPFPMPSVLNHVSIFKANLIIFFNF